MTNESIQNLHPGDRFYFKGLECVVLDPVCESCPKVSTCDHKRMAHLGYIIPARGNATLDFQKVIYESMKGRLDYENR